MRAIRIYILGIVILFFSTGAYATSNDTNAIRTFLTSDLTQNENVDSFPLTLLDKRFTNMASKGIWLCHGQDLSKLLDTQIGTFLKNRTFFENGDTELPMVDINIFYCFKQSNRFHTAR